MSQDKSGAPPASLDDTKAPPPLEGDKLTKSTDQTTENTNTTPNKTRQKPHICLQTTCRHRSKHCKCGRKKDKRNFNRKRSSSSSAGSSTGSSSDTDDPPAKQSKHKCHNKTRKRRSRTNRDAPSSSDTSSSDESSSNAETGIANADQISRDAVLGKDRKNQSVRFPDPSNDSKLLHGTAFYDQERNVQDAEIMYHIDDVRNQQARDFGIIQEQIARLTRALAISDGRVELRSPVAETSRPFSGPTVAQKSKSTRKDKSKRRTAFEFRRVDEIWDSDQHRHKLTDSKRSDGDELAQYAFNVKRQFDWDNHYSRTVVVIKSSILRQALQEVMKDVVSVSLVEDEPTINPDILFLYLEDLRTYTKQVLKPQLRREHKKKAKRQLEKKIEQCKLMVRYLDEDYDKIKKRLHPMLEAGNITFDLVWALFKPNTIAFTPTYGTIDDPRCFKVDYANKNSSFIRGEWWRVEGRYLEYDGKHFGLGDFEVDVEAFQGPRKITSLSTYPLQYHKDPEAVKKQLINRGKEFIKLQGMNYRFHKGLAYMKQRKTVAKVSINGRVMIDPAIFRHINPNYQIAYVRRNEDDLLARSADSDNEDDSHSCECGHSSSEETKFSSTNKDKVHRSQTVYKILFDDLKKTAHLVEVELDENGHAVHPERLEKIFTPSSSNDNSYIFTEDELLIASPVVLGFAFSDKLWLEFSISGLSTIEWNDSAFDSLILPAPQKTIVRALVESHKSRTTRTIDDVITGKGKGLVAVLHGTPGTGKTLTAESIAELLRCPLYTVSAGELGTDPRYLETELQKILDIAHKWGCLILLDEADVFLERRELHDIHRNALVSIFLRLLEYFQGILFLTTNRVESFDDAFQSRIHVALRYESLTPAARRNVWKLFLDKAAIQQPEDTASPEIFSPADYEALARREMNGRQIKNCVRTAQALAASQAAQLGMRHIRHVLEVAESFEKDLKGGSGYVDAMRSYT